VALVVREGVLLAGIGLALGLLGAYLVGRAMQSMLYGIGAMDLSAFGALFSAIGGDLVLSCRDDR
jgi:putative ABC transport system permease protein